MTTDFDTANEFMFGTGGVKSAAFPTIGTVWKGAVISSEIRDQTDLKTGEAKRFQNGDPMKQLVVTIQTDVRDPNVTDDDGQRSLWAKGGKGSMLEAIRNATQPHGGLRAGGILAVKYTGDGVAAKRGFDPPKFYAAQYTPPPMSMPSADMDDVPF
jgi:hypothetical protein